MNGVTVTLTFPTLDAMLAHFGPSPLPPGIVKVEVQTTGKGKDKGKSAQADSPAASPPSATPSEAVASAPTAPPSPAPAPSPAAAEPISASTPASSTEKPLEYATSGIPEKIAALAAKDRPAVIALLTEYGVKKGPELKAEQLPAFLAAINAKLEPEEALA